MPCRITDGGVSDDFGRLRDQLDVHEVVIVVEAELRSKLTVKQPEVFVRELETTGIHSPYVRMTSPRPLFRLALFRR